ncbi:MAG: T9SS type A sorting domain-containing protein [bacterium]|nr:T9SS type A sorting domain-containing protein [bacterium]
MNKFLLSLFVVVISSASFAQREATHRGKTPNPRVSLKKPEVVHSSVQNKSVIWSSTFSNTQDWLIGNSAGNSADWQISYEPSFWWSGNAQLASNSGGNAASFNSDSYAQAANQIANNAWIQSVPFSCSNFSTVAVTFQQFFNKWTGRTFIQVSNNGGQTWVDYEVNASMENNDETPNPQEVTVDITATAGSAQEVMIRFLYLSNAISDGGTDNTAGEGWDYGWIVDDVVVAELPNNDVALTNAWHANITDDYEYSMVPLSQAREIIPCVVISNEGALTQSLVVTATITKDGSVVNQSTQPVSVPYATKDTIWFNSGYIPDDIGEYNVSFSVPFDQDTSDNSISAAPLHVNDNVMAHDYGSAAIFGWNPTSTDSSIVNLANGPHGWGCIYVPEADQEIFGVDVNFAVGTSPGLEVIARILRFDQIGGIQGNLQLVREQVFTVYAQDIGTGVRTLTFAQPAMLVAGSGYIIEIYKLDATVGQGFMLGGSENSTEDDDYATVGFGPYGQGGAINYYTNWGFAPFVRANFNQILSVEENSVNNFSVHPNPTNGVITIETEENESSRVIVTNIQGRKILETELSGTQSIDLSNNASGTYVIKVSNSKGTYSKRIVLK